MSAENPSGPATPDPEIQRLREELAQTKTQYANLHSAYNRRDEEIKAVRRTPQRTSYEPVYEEPEPEPSASPNSKFTDEDIEELRYSVARSNFLATQPGAQDYWGKIDSVIKDPTKAQEFAAWDARGRVNYERVFRDIHRDLRWQEVEEARRAAAATTPPPAPVPQPTGVLTQGHASASAGPTGGMLDLDNMSPQESQQAMIDRGLVEIDPNDPPRAYTPQRRI